MPTQEATRQSVQMWKEGARKEEREEGGVRARTAEGWEKTEERKLSHTPLGSREGHLVLAFLVRASLQGPCPPPVSGSKLQGCGRSSLAMPLAEER